MAFPDITENIAEKYSKGIFLSRFTNTNIFII